MSQDDMNVANASGAVVRADINSQLDAIASNNSGAIEPSATFPYMWWSDTSSGLMKQRNGANTAWVTMYTLSTGPGDLFGSLFNANTILAANADDTPAALTVTEQTLVGRVTAGDIDALSATVVRALLNVENGADVTDAANVAGAGAVMDSDMSEAEGFMRKTGAGAYEAIKTNLSASAAPTVNDDSGDGYGVASEWFDLTADRAYVCFDAAVGAAVWKQIDSTGLGAGDMIGANNLSDVSSPLVSGQNLKLGVKGGNLTAANPLVIDTDGDYFTVAGNTNFAGMTVATNRDFTLMFTGTPTITVGSGITLNNAGANYTMAAGDIIECQSTAANTVIGWIIKASGTAVVSVDNATPTAAGILFGLTSVDATPWSTLLGFQAGLNLTSTGNTLLGIKAGKLATSLSSSVGVGFNACGGTGIATGSGHVCVGSGAGEDITSASTMTFVGKGAGHWQLTGSNCSAFGNEAEPTTTSVSNEITLGNSSIATLRCQQTSITALSDKRDKRNTQPLGASLDFINALRPVTYQLDCRDWYFDEEIIIHPGAIIPEQIIKGKTITLLIDGVETEVTEPDTVIPEHQESDEEEIVKTPKPRDGSKTLSYTDTGFIAQEVQAAIATHGNGKLDRLIHDLNPDKLELTQGDLLVPAIKAIQELSAQNADLKARLDAAGL